MKSSDTATYAVSGSGNPYVAAVTSTQEAASTCGSQTLDAYGNVTLQKVYDGASCSGTEIKGTDSAYVASSTYTAPPRHIRNRLLSGVSRSLQFNIMGVAEKVTTGGETVDAPPDANRNYAVPASITPNGTPSLSHALSWNSHLGLTQDSAPNGATTVVAYQYGLPSNVTSPHGASTSIAHFAVAPHKVTTTNGKYPRETYDGFGRTALVEVGNTTEGVKSVVETRYAPCACSPLGKVERVSRPYAPGTPENNKLWTVYTYDSLGRTNSVVQPSGSGTTVYAYVSRTVTVTDPALKKRKFEMDAVGNLVKPGDRFSFSSLRLP